MTSTITLVLCTSLAAAPAPPTNDGSTEAATLRELASRERDAQIGEAGGTRGIVYDPGTVPEGPGFDVDAGEEPTEPVTAKDLPPGPTRIDAGELEHNYELERIAKRGRSMFIPGVVLTTLGTILTIGAIAGLGAAAKKNEDMLPIGIVFGVSAATLATGVPLLVIGLRMRKHPERYNSRARASLGPGGVLVRF